MAVGKNRKNEKEPGKYGFPWQFEKEKDQGRGARKDDKNQNKMRIKGKLK